MSIALGLVIKCLDNKEPVLNLSNCGLTDADLSGSRELGALLKKCTHLTTLVLSNSWRDWTDEEKPFIYINEKYRLPRGEEPLNFLVAEKFKPFRSVRTEGYALENRLTKIPRVLSHLTDLTTLVCGGSPEEPWGIQDLSTVGELARLKTLILDFNKIREVRHLNALPDLEKLSLAGNILTNIGALAGNTRVKFLDLWGNQIKSTHKIEQFPNLRWLSVSRNSIKNIKGLQELYFLQFMDLSHNGMRELEPLSNQIFLKALNISNNQISCLTGFGRLTRLEYLIANFNRIVTIQGLDNLEKLKCLDISHNLVRKIQNLEHLAALEILDISSNHIKVLESLQGLNRLRVLNAAWNYISSINRSGLPPNLEELNLNNNLLQKISVLDHLSNLKSIYAIKNSIELVEVSKPHKNLLTAVFSNNKIRKINFVEQLQEVNCLRIDNNYLENLDGIQGLQNLEILDASLNNITHASLTQLPALKEAHLSFNSIRRIDGFGDLPSLERVNLQNNRIESIGRWENLPALQALDLAWNTLRDINGLMDLPSLRWLNVSNNLLSGLPDLLSLKSLQVLLAYGNRITSLGKIKGHPSLRELDLDGNDITHLQDVPALCSIGIVNISDNPIANPRSLINFVSRNEEARFESGYRGVTIRYKLNKVVVNIPYFLVPNEIEDQGSKSILNWLIAREQGGIMNTNAKCILSGNGEVGKTALSHYLRTREFYEVNDRTHGILINKWVIPLKDLPQDLVKKLHDASAKYIKDAPGQEVVLPESCTVYLWDFGGQEYYHATHRLFMSSSVLYLLLWQQESNVQNETKGYYPVEYWLKNIEYYSPDNITLIVQNRAEDEFSVDNKRKFKIQNYKRGDETSAVQYRIDVEKLRESMLREIFQLPYFGTFFPKVYDDIKTALQIQPKAYISYQEYEEICRQTDFTELSVMKDSSQMETLLKYLDDIGSVISFRFRKNVEAAIIKDYVFTDPVWLTGIIYEILEKEKDEFDYEHVHKVISRHSLSAELWIEIMKQFELIFEIKTSDGIRYIAPQYLPAECKNKLALRMTLGSKKMMHSFTVNYSQFLPKSNFLRLIARFGGKSIDYLYWKSGFVFFYENKTVLAECITNEEERKIKVSIQDNDKQAGADVFQNIVDIDPNSSLEVTVDESNYVSVEKIRGKVEGGFLEVESTTGKTMATESFEFLFKQASTRLEALRKIKPDKEITIFISYCREDSYLKDLLEKGLSNHLSGRVEFRFTFWSDQAIDLGAKWKEEIAKNLQRSKAAILLVSAGFVASEFIQKEEMAEFFRRKKEDGYLILPVLVRNYNYTSFEQLSGLQFFRANPKDYDKPTSRYDLLPFDALAESDEIWDRQLNEYYKDLADEIYRTVTNHFRSPGDP